MLDIEKTAEPFVYKVFWKNVCVGRYYADDPEVVFIYKSPADEFRGDNQDFWNFNGDTNVLSLAEEFCKGHFG